MDEKVSAFSCRSESCIPGVPVDCAAGLREAQRDSFFTTKIWVRTASGDCAESSHAAQWPKSSVKLGTT